MKKVILATLLLVGVTAMAQDGKRHRNGMGDLSAEQMATLQTKRMTLALDLTEAQQEQIQALNLENAKLKKAKIEARKAQKESEEKARPTSEERYAMQNERLEYQIAQKAKMKEILSQEQYEKLEKMHQNRGKHRKGKGKHGKKTKRRK